MNDEEPIEQTVEESEPWILTKTEWDHLTESQRQTLERLARLEERGTDTTSQTPSTSPKASVSEKPSPPEPTATLEVQSVQVAEPVAVEVDHEKATKPKRRRKRLF